MLFIPSPCAAVVYRYGIVSGMTSASQAEKAGSIPASRISPCKTFKLPCKFSFIMDAADLVISVLALNPDYEQAIQKSGVEYKTLANTILDASPNELLKEARITPHWFHRDSMTLYNALRSLISYGILRLWSPGNFYTWNFPQTPREYFDSKIKPNLTAEKLGSLEKFALSLG